MSKDTTIKARRLATKTAFLVMRKLKLEPVKMELECSVTSAYNYEKSVHAVLTVHSESGPQSPLSDFCNIGFKFNEVTSLTIRVTVTECHLEIVVHRSNRTPVMSGILDNCYKPGIRSFVNALPVVSPLHPVRARSTSYVC